MIIGSMGLRWPTSPATTANASAKTGKLHPPPQSARFSCAHLAQCKTVITLHAKSCFKHPPKGVYKEMGTTSLQGTKAVISRRFHLFGHCIKGNVALYRANFRVVTKDGTLLHSFTVTLLFLFYL